MSVGHLEYEYEDEDPPAREYRYTIHVEKGFERGGAVSSV